MRREGEPAALTAKDLGPLIKRLDTVIALLARTQPLKERAKISERIRLLSKLGLDNVTIAGIVGRGTNYVGATVGRSAKRTPRRAGTRGRKTKARR